MALVLNHIHRLVGLGRAFLPADTAALAVVIINSDHFAVFYYDSGIRAIQPAEKAMYAFSCVVDRFGYAPAACLIFCGAARLKD